MLPSVCWRSLPPEDCWGLCRQLPALQRREMENQPGCSCLWIFRGSAVDGELGRCVLHFELTQTNCAQPAIRGCACYSASVPSRERCKTGSREVRAWAAQASRHAPCPDKRAHCAQRAACSSRCQADWVHEAPRRHSTVNSRRRYHARVFTPSRELPLVGLPAPTPHPNLQPDPGGTRRITGGAA